MQLPMSGFISVLHSLLYLWHCLQGFTSELTDDPTWMVDPVDGTTNFVHRFPFVCVCIGLAIKKEVGVRSLLLCHSESAYRPSNQ